MTEKNYNPEQMNAKSIKKQEKVKAPLDKAPVKKEKIEEKNLEEVAEVKEKEDKKEIKKQTIVTKKVAKEFAVINGRSVPVSTKYSVEICRHIKGRKIDDAINVIELAINKKKAIPMRGEYAHQKGKGMTGGKFPERAGKSFIMLLKSLKSNAIFNEIENPVIVEAYANKAQMPYGRFGATQKKRTHIVLKVKALGAKK
jgi:ribosomal protein L22